MVAAERHGNGTAPFPQKHTAEVSETLFPPIPCLYCQNTP